MASVIQTFTDVVQDVGNSLWKDMIQGRPNTALVYPHAIKYITERAFMTESKRFKSGYIGMNDLDYGTFSYRYKRGTEWHTIYVSAGSTAEKKSTEDAKVGGEKYIREYYGVAVCYLLLQRFRDGMDNIRLTIGHPATDIEYRDAMIDSIIGKHYLQLLDGRKVKFEIRQIIPYEEGVAAARNFVYTRDGVHYRPIAHELRGKLGIDINIGGAISSVTPTDPQTGWVDYGGSTSIGKGINDIMKDVSQGIVSQYSRQFTDNRDGSLPNDIRMRDAIVNGVYHQKGYPLKVKEIVDDAVAIFLQDLRSAVIKAGGVSRFGFMTISGGGGGYLWGRLLERDVFSFNPDFIFPAVDDDQVMHKEGWKTLVLDDMHLSVLLGADKTTSAKLYKISEDMRGTKRNRR